MIQISLLLALATFVLLNGFISANVQYDSVWTLTGGNSKGLGHGFNIRTQVVSGDPLLNRSLSGSFHYGKNGNLSSRYLIPGNSYGDSNSNKAKAFSDSTIYKSFEDFYKLRVSNWGFSAGLTIYGFGVDVSYSKLKGQLAKLTNNFTKSFTYGYYTWHSFDLVLDDYKQLDPEFKTDVMSLQTPYSPATKPLYMKFITIYGTHFFTKVAYGCRYTYSLAMNNKFIDTQDSKWVQTQIGISASYSYGGFGIKLGFDFNKFKNTTQINGQFKENSTGKATLLGGDETCLPKGLETWQKSCDYNKEILLDKSDYMPIVKLFDFDPARKAAMFLALKDYAKLKL